MYMKTKISTLWGIVILLIISGGVYWYLDYAKELTDISEVETIRNNNVKNVNTKTNENISNEVTVVTAYIDSIIENKITLDYIDVLTGEEAIEALIADGKCTRELENTMGCLTNGVYDRNINTKLRTFILSPNVKIVTASAFQKSPDGVINISIQELKKDFVDIYSVDGVKLTIPYEITLNNKSEVIFIKEIYRP